MSAYDYIMERSKRVKKKLAKRGGQMKVPPKQKKGTAIPKGKPQPTPKPIAKPAPKPIAKPAPKPVAKPAPKAEPKVKKTGAIKKVGQKAKDVAKAKGAVVGKGAKGAAEFIFKGRVQDKLKGAGQTAKDTFKGSLEKSKTKRKEKEEKPKSKFVRQ